MIKIALMFMMSFLFVSNSIADFQTFTKIDGLGSNLVTDIAVDVNGDVWVSTGIGSFEDDGGVARYNGVDWKLFTTADGLIGKNVNAVAVDANGGKWFATTSGVSKFNNAAWEDFTSDGCLAHDTVNDIAISGEGNIWFATSGGVSKYDGITWNSYYEDSDGLEGPINKNVRTIAVAPDGVIWAGTSGGVSKYDGADWTTFTSETSGLVYNWVNGVAFDATGNVVWFATARGISKLDVENMTWTNYTTENGLPVRYISGVDIDEKGNKWFATPDGILKFDDSDWRLFTVSDGLHDDNMKSVFIAEDGTKWFGTSSGGVSRYYSVLDMTITPFEAGAIEWLNGNCLRECSGIFFTDTEITLTVTPQTSFNYWEGCDSVSGNQFVVNMSSSKRVKAVFDSFNPTPLKADINDDDLINLTDAILSLQVLSGIASAEVRGDYATSGVDVSGDNKIGLEEVLFQLQDMASIIRSTGLLSTMWDQAGHYSYRYDINDDPCEAAYSCDIEYGAEYRVGSAAVSVGQLINHYLKKGYRQGWLENIMAAASVTAKFETAEGIAGKTCTHSGYSPKLMYVNFIEDCDSMDSINLKTFLWNIALGLNSTFRLAGSSEFEIPDYTGYLSYEEKLKTLLIDRFHFNSNMTVSAGLDRIDAEKEYIIAAVDRGEPVLMVMWGEKDGVQAGHTVLIEGYKDVIERGFSVVMNYGLGGRDRTNSVYPGKGPFTDNLGYAWNLFSIFKDVMP